MTIDVQPGDTFTIDKHGVVRQWRDNVNRLMGNQEFWNNTQDAHARKITLLEFRTIAQIAGHTVTEVVPEPEPVVVTHGIEHPSQPGVFSFVGTKEAITKFAKERKDNAVPITLGRTATC